MKKVRKIPDDQIVLTENMYREKGKSLNEILDTGVIVESGSNAQGEYIKFANGLMICTRIVTTTISCTSTWGALYYGRDDKGYSFAKEFINVPHVQLTLLTTTGTSCWLTNYTKPTITKTYYQYYAIIRPTTSEAVPVQLNILAIGRWK